MTAALGQLVHSFFEDQLKVQAGLRPNSIRSYRDALRLLLEFVARDRRCRITQLVLTDLTFERTQQFLRYLEQERNNHIPSRNQRLAALRTFFEYVARRSPEMLDTCEQVALIPRKRACAPQTHFLQRHELAALFKSLAAAGPRALRDRTLLLLLYNTGARVQEVADLRWEHLELNPPARVQLHGKGNKWRTCPLWAETAEQLRLLMAQQKQPPQAETPVFVSRPGRGLTRFGIYKIVRRHCAHLDCEGGQPRHVSPHLFRHTAAVHLLESGVEVNVIRGWLGHVSLETTNRYAEITTPLKEAALRVCELPWESSVGSPRRPVWKDDEALLAWLKSL
jgi:site-specific recombinase XerD